MSSIDRDFEVHGFDSRCSLCQQAQVIVTPGTVAIDTDVLDRLTELKYICCLGSGYEGIDIGYARQRGIIVSNSAVVTAEDVADHSIAITLAQCGQIPSLQRAVLEDRGQQPVRRSLRELKAGIVGLGAIGRAVAHRLEVFGPEIRWTGPNSKESPYSYCASLYQLADWSDLLIVTARADSSNVGMIDTVVLDLLGPQGVLVNISRGSIVDEDALIAALKERRLGGAALDVFRSEPTSGDRWRDVPNIVLTPHVGGFATGVLGGIQTLLLENLHAFFGGTPLKGVVTGSP